MSGLEHQRSLELSSPDFNIYLLGMNPENKGLSIGNCPELAQVEIQIKIKLEKKKNGPSNRKHFSRSNIYLVNIFSFYAQAHNSHAVPRARRRFEKNNVPTTGTR